jgi:hypothetical protein
VASAVAYDHIDLVVDMPGHVTALYVARARPDLWKPETKVDHRRVIMPGVWIARKPADESDDEFWAARRAIGLVHGVTPARLSDEGCAEVLAHFFADEQAVLSGATEDEQSQEEGVGRQKVDEVQVLSTHLGKAGGLNFGLEALVHCSALPPPSPTNPYIFGIVDARHSSDKRWWKMILPQ